jgi:predicted AAA+ superfamily ATPase
MKTLSREAALAAAERLLRRYPVVAILGARQVGKTTLAAQLAARFSGPTERFDLEDPADLARLTDPMVALRPRRGLVVLDEVQRRPDLFPALRVLADRSGTPARFLVLGSATQELLRQTSESLAGRIAFLELNGLGIDEVGPERLETLWRRGGFPRSFLARSEPDSGEWRQNFIRTFLERDVPALDAGVPVDPIRRLWHMLAHYHGQVLNASELGRALGTSHTSIRRYLDFLANTFVVRLLQPWSANLAKRQVRHPKVYLADSGILHTMLGLTTQRDVERHPKVGASWEGFLLEQVIRLRGTARDRCFFWGTHAGAELDLLVAEGSRRVGYEFKRTVAPSITPSIRSAIADLGLGRLDIVHAGETTFPLAKRIRAVSAHRLTEDL